MENEAFKTVAESIFEAVKESVILNIQDDLREILTYDKNCEDYRMFLNVCNNYGKIFEYYDDEYIMEQILNYLSLVIEDDDDLLIFGFYHTSTLKSTIDYVVNNIRKIGYPQYIRYDYIYEFDFSEVLKLIPEMFGDLITTDDLLKTALMELYSHWYQEVSYIHMTDCKQFDRQYDELNYFDKYVNTHLDVLAYYIVVITKECCVDLEQFME